MSSHVLNQPRVWLLAGAVALASGCARDPLEVPCPAAGEGDLVITEIRGDQSGEDTYGQWIEIYNTSAGAIDLEGLTVTMLRIDGGADARILVRTSVMVAPGDYAVIGRFDQGTEPAHIDYGYLPEGCAEQATSTCPSGLTFGDNFYNAGSIELSACSVTLDRVIFRDLPSTGTWSYDGSLTPDATANDVETDWCTDDIDDMPDPTELGVRGTPGEVNRACP